MNMLCGDLTCTTNRDKPMTSLRKYPQEVIITVTQIAFCAMALAKGGLLHSEREAVKFIGLFSAKIC